MVNKAITLDGKVQYLGTQADTFESLRLLNEWTIGFWSQPRASKEFRTILSMGKIGERNNILITTTPIPATDTGTSELRVLISDANAEVIKHYGWGDWFSNSAWTHTIVQWDGSNLSASRNGVAANYNAVLVNSSGVMSDDSERKVFYGSTVTGYTLATFSGSIGHCGLWSTVLSGSEITVVFSGGLEIDLTTSSGNYVSDVGLQHYFKPGEDPSDIGRDFATSGTLINLEKLQGVTVANIITASGLPI